MTARPCLICTILEGSVAVVDGSNFDTGVIAGWVAASIAARTKGGACLCEKHELITVAVQSAIEALASRLEKQQKAKKT